MRGTIQKKLWVLSFVYFLVTLVLLVLIIYQFLGNLSQGVKDTRTTMYTDYDRMIRYQVQTAHSLLEAVHKRVVSGELTEEAGKKLAADLLRDLRYGDNGKEYIFVDDLQGNTIVHANRSLEGTSMENYQDAKGQYIIQERRKLALQGGGYLDYYFPRPGETNPSPKRGYSKLFEPYGWVLGTGLYVDDIEAAIAQELKKVETARRNLVIKILIAVLAVVVVVIIIQRIIHKEISTPLAGLAHEALKIGEGDFEVHINESWKKLGGEIENLVDAFEKLYSYVILREDEIMRMAEADFSQSVRVVSEKDKLGKSLQNLSENIGRLVGEVRNTVEQFNIGAEQLSKASQTLSQGANEQASSLEEITSALTEINAQVKQNAERAVKARDLSKATMARAQKGEEGIQNLVEIMQRLNNAAADINAIVKTIDDIAFQINLLALNANVEAARAGKYGKGFAVVADEVRNLAVKSANSVKETTVKVRDIVGAITRGHEITSEVASQIEQMYTNMYQTTEMNEEVAASSQEQLLSMERVNQGIHEINQVTQTTASSAEATASSAEELASQATLLKRLIAQFKVAQTVNSSLVEQKRNGGETVQQSIEMSSGQPGIAQKRVIKLDDDDFGKF